MDDKDPKKIEKIVDNLDILNHVKTGLEWKLKLSYKVFSSLERLTEIYHE